MTGWRARAGTGFIHYCTLTAWLLYNSLTFIIITITIVMLTVVAIVIAVVIAWAACWAMAWLTVSTATGRH